LLDWRGFEEGNFTTDEQLPDFTDIEIPRDNISSELPQNEVSARVRNMKTFNKKLNSMFQVSTINERGNRDWLS